MGGLGSCDLWDLGILGIIFFCGEGVMVFGVCVFGVCV